MNIHARQTAITALFATLRHEGEIDDSRLAAEVLRELEDMIRRTHVPHNMDGRTAKEKRMNKALEKMHHASGAFYSATCDLREVAREG